MKSNQIPEAWSRLAATVRAVPDARPTAAPFGFSTRVAALALGVGRFKASLLERFAFRAISCACLLAIGSVLLNFSAITAEVRVEAVADDDDLVAVLLAE